MRLLAPNGEIYLVVTTKGDVSLDVSSLFGELMEVNQTSVSDYPFLGYFYRLPGVGGVGGSHDSEDKIGAYTYAVEPLGGGNDNDSLAMSSMTNTCTTERETHDRNRMNCNEINRLHGRIVFVLQAQPPLNVLELRNELVAGTLDPATLPQVKQLNRVLYDMKEKNLIVCGPPKVGTKSKKPTWTIM